VLDAVVAGRLAVSRLEEAHTRIRALAAWITAAAAGPVPGVGDGGGDGGVGLELARRALVTTGSVRLPGPPHVLDLRTDANKAAGRHAPKISDALTRLAPDTTSSVLAPDGAGGARASAEFASAAAGLAAAAGRPLVVVVDNPHRDPAQAALLRTLVSARPDAVVVGTGLSAPGFSLGENIVLTFGAGAVNALAAAEVLLGAQARPT
jgi:beta-N-acetylhexosaminidase